MKNTKTLILETALQLFNKQGLSQVTLRTIAQELGISQGNLNYHFKKREDIIEALYQELVAKMDETMVQMQLQKNELSFLFEQSKAMMHCFYEYRFFMLDFVQIMREYLDIQTHYLQLQEMRKMQFLGLFQILIQQGLMRPKELENEYEHLYVRMTILGDFWLSSAITTQVLTQDLIAKYNVILFEELYPYLTPKGKEQFRTIDLNNT